jgi:hypothetical protein
MTNDLERATALIVDLHEFFTAWVSGRCLKDKALFAEKAKKHLSSDFLGIMPNGWSFNPSVFEGSMWDGHGNSPKFRIKIRDVQVRHRIGNALVVTYEEWAHDAADAPHNNARLSTMVLRTKTINLRLSTCMRRGCPRTWWRRATSPSDLRVVRSAH